jgi:hypothetical protein
MKYITKKQLSEKLEPINLKALITQETNGRMRIRLLTLLHVKDGVDRTQDAGLNLPKINYPSLKSMFNGTV